MDEERVPDGATPHRAASALRVAPSAIPASPSAPTLSPFALHGAAAAAALQRRTRRGGGVPRAVSWSDAFGPMERGSEASRDVPTHACVETKTAARRRSCTAYALDSHDTGQRASAPDAKEQRGHSCSLA
ncbi:unnamed protein product [Lampetra planeri]